jgi:hypothetical protein
MLLDMATTACMECSDIELAFEEGFVLSLDASLSTRRAWNDSRSMYHLWGSRARRGHAEGTQQALNICRGLTMVCVRCESLVHWMAARCRARKAGRDTFAPGDGCSSRSCSLNHRPAQHASSQLAMAAGLKTAERLLVLWPSGRAARQVEVLPRARTLATVHTVRVRSKQPVHRATAVSRASALGGTLGTVTAA